MKRLLIYLMLLFASGTVHGQALFRYKTDSLLKMLNKKPVDSTRIDVLLKLAQYYILREGENKPYLMDSAAIFINAANKLSAGIKPMKYDGYVTLIASYLTIERRDTTNGKILVNKAIQRLKADHDDYHLTVAYIELSKYYNSKDPKQSAVINSLINTAISRLPTLTSPKNRNYCVLSLERFYQTNLSGWDAKAKLNYLDRILHTCRQLGDQTNAIWVQREIVNINLQQGETASTETELLELLKNQKAAGYAQICLTYALLAAAYIDDDNYNSALYYALESVKSVKTASDSSHLTEYYARLAYIYDAVTNEDQRVAWNMKSLNYKIAKKQTDYIYGDIQGIIEGEINLNRAKEALRFILSKRKSFPPANISEQKAMTLSLGECYAALNENTLAEKYYLETIRLVKIQIAQKNIEYDIKTDEIIATFYLKTKQLGKAGDFYNKVLNEIPQTQKSLYEFYRNDFMFKLDSSSGRYFAAIRDLQRRQKVTDSVFSKAKIKQVEDLQISYETKEKEKDLNSLGVKEKLEKIELQRAENTRNWIIAGSCMLLIIAGLLYRQNALRKKNSNIIRHKNELLQGLLKEKEWLLKEVHHRVKNNLHTVICLLESQAAYLESDALKANENSQHRIYAMSLIHQKLYQSDDVKSIDMATYIPELVQYLEDSFGMSGKIYFVLNIDSINLDIGYAIPLGLIINEAVTNAFKYAFPGERNGRISISMNEKDGSVKLEIADNGVGMPDITEENEPESLGIELMKGLSGDIDATITFEVNNGTKISLIFERHESVDTDTYLSKFKTKEIHL